MSQEIQATPIATPDRFIGDSDQLRLVLDAPLLENYAMAVDLLEQGGYSDASRLAYFKPAKLAEGAIRMVSTSRQPNFPFPEIVGFAGVVDRDENVYDENGHRDFAGREEKWEYALRNMLPQAIGLLHTKPTINKDGMILVRYAYPRKVDLPPKPTKQPDGSFKYDGNDLTVGEVERDMVYSAHYLADNPVYAEYGRLYLALAKVLNQAHEGRIVVPANVTDPQGAMSLSRQMARFMGYDVDAFVQQTDGSFVMPVVGRRPAFSKERTTLLTERSAPKPVEKVIQELGQSLPENMRAPGYLAILGANK